MAASIVCAPADMLEQYKCLKCLSEQQLWAVILYAISTQTDYSLPDDLNALMEDSACFTCLGNKEMIQAAARLQAGLYLSDKTVQEIRNEIKCLLCSTPKQIQSALLYLLCQQAMNPRVLDAGIATLSGANTTVNSASADADNPILLTYEYVGGAAGTVYITTITDGVSFVIHSTNAADTNKVSWLIIQG